MPHRRIKVLSFIFILICLLRVAAYGQENIHLSIRLINKEDNMPIKFANISLIDSAGKAVQLRLSDENGKCSFVVSSPMNQKLRLYTAPFGFKEYYSKVLAYKSGLNQDTIFLSKEAIVLQEVKIYKQQTIQDGEKLIYRPKLDQFSSTKTIVQLLPRLPGVALVSGKLKLNGNDGVLLLIDGKGELVSQSQQIEMLRTLSADKIEKIEIIQTPSARYDSNITSVIDIITKKEKGSSTVRVNLAQPFFMDNQTLGVDFLSTGASANFNFNVGELGLQYSSGCTMQSRLRIQNSRE